MASTAIHRKKNGTAYVYSVESYWDKEKKAPRNKQVCLGRLDKETGEIIPSKKKKLSEDGTVPEAGIQANVKVCGPYLLLMKVADDIGLSSALRKSFPDSYKKILSLAFSLHRKDLRSPDARCGVEATNIH